MLHVFFINNVLINGNFIIAKWLLLTIALAVNIPASVCVAEPFEIIDISGEVNTSIGGITFAPGTVAVKNQVVVIWKNSLRRKNRAKRLLRTALQATKDEESSIKEIGMELYNVSWEKLITMSENDAMEIIGAAKYIEPNYVLSLQGMPNDPEFDKMWNLENTGQTGGKNNADIDAVKAWDIQNEGVIIAIIDSGVDYTHPDLSDNMWINPGEIPGDKIDNDGNGCVDDVHGCDFINKDGDPMDDNGHGTHVAGIIAAVGNNDLGITGINWKAKIMALKVFDDKGVGSEDALVNAIRYAVRNGARISNYSGAMANESQILKVAIAKAGEGNHLLVTAAGNSNKNMDDQTKSCDSNPINLNEPSGYPAGYDLDNILSVAATTQDDTAAPYSNCGIKSVDLGAPGGVGESNAGIYSTVLEGKYAYFQGTSMAAPHVTGVASLLLAANPTISATQIKTKILASVDEIPELRGKSVTGGRLNMYNTLTGRLSSIGVNGFVGMDDQSLMIVGFSIKGTGSKMVAVRAQGCVQGANSPLDFKMNVHNYVTGEYLAGNDNWRNSNTAMELQNLGLTDDLCDWDAGLVLNLSEGSYTVQASPNNIPGIGRVEIYSFDDYMSNTASLTGLSVRAFIGQGTHSLTLSTRNKPRANTEVLSGRFVLDGNGNTRIMVRAVGQGLAKFGIASNLDPSIELVPHDGMIPHSNDNWRINNPTPANLWNTLEALNASYLHNFDAAMLLELPEGGYTVNVVPKNNSSGIGLVDFYIVD